LPKIRNLLGAFLFRGDDIEKSVRVLSGGERSRLALLKMLLHPANLLILDEPTNHLDLTSKDVLLEALKSFAGTVLFVSHDRAFIEELADRVLELEDGASPRWFVGDYRYYLEKKAAIRAEGEAASASLGAPERGAAAAPRAASYEEDKARKARARKLQKREEEILARLEAIGAQKAAAEREMGLPANYSDGGKMKRLSAGVEELEGEAAALNAEWELVVAELGSE
jgi:ATP-binding cassette, subfamily F, member 3